jgi:hypothetical protein
VPNPTASPPALPPPALLSAAGGQSSNSNPVLVSLQGLPDEDLPVAQPRFAAPKLHPVSASPPTDLGPPKLRAPAAALAPANRLRPMSAHPSASPAPRSGALSRPATAAAGSSRSVTSAAGKLSAGAGALGKSDAGVTTGVTSHTVSLLERWLHVIGRVAASCRGAAKELFRSGLTTLLAEVVAEFRASSHPVVLAAEEAWAQVVRNCQVCGWLG